MTNGIRKLSLLLGFARAGILLVLVLFMIPTVARVSAAKSPPPRSTGSSFATAYSVPYSYSVAKSISQASSGGFVVGALCSAAAERSQGDLGRGRHLRRPTPIRLPSSEPELLWGNRKSGLDRESSMGQQPAIRHQRHSILVASDLAFRHSADH